jgi:hypothetical protein
MAAWVKMVIGAAKAAETTAGSLASKYTSASSVWAKLKLETKRRSNRDNFFIIYFF